MPGKTVKVSTVGKSFDVCKCFVVVKIFDIKVRPFKIKLILEIRKNFLKSYQKSSNSIEFDVIHQTNQFLLVLEYADGSTLNNFLNQNFEKLDWNDKYQLALQLASAHANNILVHQKRIKLADFGLSRKIAETSYNANKFGVIPYMDPKFLDNKNKSYILNKKSDVYSVGVLMWQISSGYRPFDGIDYDLSLSLSIVGGIREKIVDGTPFEYKCWNYEPEKRPDINEVVLSLKKIASLEQIDIENDIFIDNHHKESNLYINNESSFKTDETSEIFIDNDDLILEDTFNQFKNIIESEPENNSNLQKQKSSLIYIEAKNNPYFQISNLSISSLESLELYNNTINNIIDYIIKKHDKGFTFDQIEDIIKKTLLQFNQTINNLLNWLIKNQDKLKYIWFLGLLYYHNIDIDDDSFKAFELFLKAAKGDYSIAQVYIAKCYYDGYGTEKNYKLAFKNYQKSVENGSILGQYYLGYCYTFGIGIQKNKEKSIYWYEEATNNGNMIARLYLADCYRLGNLIKKDENKAFEYYNILAKKEISDAQYQLGNYYYSKNETKINEARAFHCYFRKAVENGNIIAQFNLGNCFMNGNGIEKNERKAFKLFNIAAKKELVEAQNNLAFCYQKGIGIEKNEVKAFELYNIAANKEY
ncbi:18681_t:CDS:2, partial [Funneliformis geosporum]